MSKNNIYFDHNATTTVLPEVKEAVFNIIDFPYNPSSIHYHGRKARHLMEDARKKILFSLGVEKDYDLIFTSSGTEANNLLIENVKDGHLFASSIDHISVIEPVKRSKNFDFIKVTAGGLLNIDDLEFKLKNCNSKKKLVSVILANNETGVIQDIKTISSIAKKYSALIHTDAVQALGKINLNIEDLDIDFMTISAHKIGGLFGAAALIKKKNFNLVPMVVGGSQEKGERGGTENILAIIGFSEAVSLLPSILNEYINIKKIRDFIEDSILEFLPEVKIYSLQHSRLPNTSCIAMPKVNNEIQLMNFDLEGISVSAGSACSSGKVSVSHVLSAMNSEDKLAQNAIRISLGRGNTLLEAQKFVNIWKNIYIKANLYKTSIDYRVAAS